MRLNIHLNFNGQCEEAFRTYEKCLGGEVTLMLKYVNSPLAGQVSPSMGDKIAHATLTLGDQILAGADTAAEHFQKPQGFGVLLSLGSATEADRVFSALAEGGKVQMAMQETFWALRFGMLTDRFGTPWMINCERPG